MEYIRTKDDIYKKHGNLQIIDNSLCIMRNKRVWWVLGEVLKQADTLKELCDEFVYHLKSGGSFIDEELANKFDIYESVYGAIWTDKGLIYVAKMNDKGKLELLWA